MFSCDWRSRAAPSGSAIVSRILAETAEKIKYQDEKSEIAELPPRGNGFFDHVPRIPRLLLNCGVRARGRIRDFAQHRAFFLSRRALCAWDDRAELAGALKRQISPRLPQLRPSAQTILLSGCGLCHSRFEFVSNFGFRASNFRAPQASLRRRPERSERGGHPYCYRRASKIRAAL